MTYIMLTNDRKQVVKKLEELAGARSEYTRMPRMAYILEGIAVEKDGTVTTEEGANLQLIEALIREGLIAEERNAETVEVEESAEEDAETREEPSAHANHGRTEIEGPAEEESAYSSYDDLIEQEPEEEAEEEDEEAVKPSISFPLSAHRAESMINLVCTMYSRGKLLSKATGGEFGAGEDLVDRLQMLSGNIQKEEVLGIIEEESTLKGLSFGEDKVFFDGFPATTDPEVIRAWVELSVAINRNAIKQIHVRAKEVDDTNEKFAFRTWLTRLGMNGPELKAERQKLYRNLSGHTAFRTSRDEEKWKAKQAAKREALKAQKAAAERAEESVAEE